MSIYSSWKNVVHLVWRTCFSIDDPHPSGDDQVVTNLGYDTIFDENIRVKDTIIVDYSTILDE